MAWWNRRTACESPVEEIRKTLPRGTGDWVGYSHVYRNIAQACELMARKKYIYLSEEHVRTMAILGCGHEETMKYEQMRLRMRGFISVVTIDPLTKLIRSSE